jgi:hypothetical protein
VCYIGRNRSWKPAQKAAGIAPLRRVYDLRQHLRDLRAPREIDRHYGREHAIKRLDTYQGAEALNVHQVDTPWTPNEL